MVQLIGQLALLVFFAAVGGLEQSNISSTARSATRNTQLTPEFDGATISETSKRTSPPGTLMLSGKSRVKKARKRKGKKGAFRKKKPSRLSYYDKMLRAAQSQNAANRECQKWSPDLEVKVITTEVALMINYCADSASPKTKTCIQEVQPALPYSKSAPKCQILDQSNCTAMFRGLTEGKWYNVTIKAYCRCEERRSDPCAVRRFFKGPYQIPVPTLTKEATKSDTYKDFFHHKAWVFPVFYAGFVAVALTTAFLCWLRYRPKSSRDTNENNSSSMPSTGSRHNFHGAESRDNMESLLNGRSLSRLDVETTCDLDKQSCCESQDVQTSLKEPHPNDHYRSRSCFTVYYKPDDHDVTTEGGSVEGQ